MSIYEGLSADKLAVVLDLGARYTKFGFIGEFAPRCIIPSEIKCPSSGKIRYIYSYTDENDLYSLLVEFVHMLFFKHVLVTPKDRHVVIVESLLCPTLFRDTLAKVLYRHFEVASILFVPSHLVALCTLGVKTALVIDVGYEEVQIIPVYEGVPILKAWQAQPLAAKAIEARLRNNFINAYNNMKNAAGDCGDTDTFAEDVSELPDSVIEDIKVRGCFVTTMERSEMISKSEPVKEPPPLKYRIKGDKLILIPGICRETAFEVLFERDNDTNSIQDLVLKSILECGIDTRKQLAENLFLVGGTVMAPGFKSRFMREVKALLHSPEYCDRLPLNTVKLHNPPAKDNYTCWLGGAIFGATDMLQMRSLSREKYLSLNTVPDWSNLAHNELVISKLPT
ncbi:hypothetical protein AAG570_008797 [Ranatra chinensis]|uniref:Actin-related protein 10 n=1 Tax=Ranatra chinensis TaxID=642074 RepID=A0ABD0YRX4_9HEMI